MVQLFELIWRLDQFQDQGYETGYSTRSSDHVHLENSTVLCHILGVIDQAFMFVLKSIYTHVINCKEWESTMVCTLRSSEKAKEKMGG